MKGNKSKVTSLLYRSLLEPIFLLLGIINKGLEKVIQKLCLKVGGVVLVKWIQQSVPKKVVMKTQ